jgi:hypothetical protein
MTIEAVPVAADPQEKCWICGVNDANSGEHSIKKSDLRDVMGKPSQAAPFYFYKPGRQVRRVGSLDAELFKTGLRVFTSPR